MSTDKGYIRVKDVRDEMVNILEKGEEMGQTTYFKAIDPIWKWRRKEVTIWTGYGGEGKTEFLRFLCLIKAIMDGSKFAFFCPENYPAPLFFSELAHAFVGLSPYYHHTYNKMDIKTLYEAIDFLHEHFFFVYPKEAHTLENVQKEFVHLIEEFGIYGTIIDPYLKLYHKHEPGETEAGYVSRFMSEMERFSRQHNISSHLVAHQLTATKKENSDDYHKPDIYRIKGGGNFADGTDNAIIVWRPFRRSEPQNPTVIIESQKIKRHDLVGIPDKVELTFRLTEKRYFHQGISPMAEAKAGKLRQSAGTQKELTPLDFSQPLKDQNHIDTDEEDDLPF